MPAISRPSRRPLTCILTPLTPARIVLPIACFIARRKETLFELCRDALRNELCVCVELSHFGDVDDDLLALGELDKVLLDDFDLGTGLADEHAGTARVDGDDDLARRPLDEDLEIAAA